MLNYFIRKVIYKMILNGELKLVLDKGVHYAESPNKQLMKKVPTIVLTVKDKDDSPLAISAILTEDVLWEERDLK